MASQGLAVEEYNSADDEDFNPEQSKERNASDESSSEAEDDPPTDGRKAKRRRQGEDKGDFENSGDESILRNSKRKKFQKRTAPNEADGKEEEHWVKTRAQRRAEGNQKKPLAQAGKSSIDVDILWARMSNQTTHRQSDSSIQQSIGNSVSDDDSKQDETDDLTVGSKRSSTKARLADRVATRQHEKHEADVAGAESGLINIKRVYKFAGELQEEERTVPADSAEARLYLQQKATQQVAANTASKPAGLRRPIKKKTSIFADKADTPSASTTAKGFKLTTLEKSKLDWAAHVDEEGIADELDTHRRAKDTYIGRLDFLSRMDAKRDEEAQSRKPR